MKRPSRLVTAILVAGAMAFAATTSADALEVRSSAPALPVYYNGPNKPRLLVLGDSISATQEQEDTYAFLNASGWGFGTEVRATPGFTILNHHPSTGNDFAYAQANPNSTIFAVFVELGTNDMGSETFAKNLTNNQLSAVWDQVKFAMEAMPRKCVVWMGLDSRGNVEYTAQDAANFNQFIWSHTAEHGGGYPNLHYANYDALVQRDAKVRDALAHDGYGFGVHFGGANAPYARTQLAQLEFDTVSKFCLAGIAPT